LRHGRIAHDLDPIGELSASTIAHLKQMWTEHRGRIDGEYRMRSPPPEARSRTRGWRTATGPMPVMISRCGRLPWRHHAPLARFDLETGMFCEKLSISASTAWVSSARAPLPRTSVRKSVKAAGWASLMTLLSETAYHSFFGEMETLNTTTIHAALSGQAVTNLRT